MYKVFINEKRISISNAPEKKVKNLQYEGDYTFDMGIDLLENTSTAEVNIYDSNEEEVWNRFKNFLPKIDAAGGVVQNSEHKILFIYRQKKWDLPKGKMEKGESYEETALREVEEETKISGLELKDFLLTTYHLYKEKNGKRILKTVHWYSMNYKGNEQPQPQVEEGITKVQWMDKQEILEKVIKNTFGTILLVLEKVGIDVK